MLKKDNNRWAIILSFSAIFLLLSFSLVKNFWQKETDQAKEAASKEEETQKIEEVKKKLSFISPEEVEKRIGQENTLLVDLRPNILFEDYHIESSVNLTIDQLLTLSDSDRKKDLVLIDNLDSELDAEKLIQLTESGLKIFYLEGGFEKYQALGLSMISFGYPDSPFDVAKTKAIDAPTLKTRVENGENLRFLDVREKIDFEKSHISGSYNIPLEELEKKKTEVPFGRIVVVDENPLRSFRAAVKLFDMHFIDVVYLSESLSTLKK